jgi:hypothetical protein
VCALGTNPRARTATTGGEHEDDVVAAVAELVSAAATSGRDKKKRTSPERRHRRYVAPAGPATGGRVLTVGNEMEMCRGEKTRWGWRCVSWTMVQLNLEVMYTRYRILVPPSPSIRPPTVVAPSPYAYGVEWSTLRICFFQRVAVRFVVQQHPSHSCIQWSRRWVQIDSRAKTPLPSLFNHVHRRKTIRTHYT